MAQIVLEFDLNDYRHKCPWETDSKIIPHVIKYCTLSKQEKHDYNDGLIKQGAWDLTCLLAGIDERIESSGSTYTIVCVE